MQLYKLWKVLTRKKPLIESYLENSELSRVLGLVDLTALGIASTLGTGVYIVAGSIARVAGPGACLSFLIAGLTSALSALCYGEFAARVPKAGSAYVYSYVTMGELVAFVVGWNLGLEYVIGTACVAQGISTYVDSIFGDVISDFLSKSLPVNLPYLSSYPDVFAFLIMMSFSILLAFGVMLSSGCNKMFTSVNLITIIILIAAGIYKADFNNWFIIPSDIPEGKQGGSGGFLPFGVTGVISGAAKCFYSYTGFDCVATTGEEAKNPQRLIPLALILTLLTALIAYLGISTSLTLMWPYYDQNIRAPFPYAFDKTGLTSVRWIVITGALCAMFACMVGSVYSMSRIMYSMACDGLIFKSLSYVNSNTQTPLTATLATGIFTGIVAMLFDTEMLVDMTSIGTLMAYTVVSISVLVLRYSAQDISAEEQITQGVVDDSQETSADDNINSEGIINSINNHNNGVIKNNLLESLFNINYLSGNNKRITPTIYTSAIVKWMTLLFVLSCTVICGCFSVCGIGNLLAINVLVFICGLIMIFSLVAINRQPQSKENLSFKVKFVPIIPAISTFMNILLMMMLNLQTWMRFFIWMLLGKILKLNKNIAGVTT
ncbi:cationic amino acid transporter 2-like isoform X2 [Lycorma delicatula]|uniref:cationic amino acid transporter 2-like isoform X2 n=1 Tax=Lycorma delicatula TaxID=130591 RepID=UPI003F5122B5